MISHAWNFSYGLCTNCALYDYCIGEQEHHREAATNLGLVYFRTTSPSYAINN